MNFVCYLPRPFSFLCSFYFMGTAKRKRRADFVWETTPWLRRRLLFVLSLIEGLLLFIGARQRGQQGRQSYADHIEGLHYLEASYFLFSLKGRVRESISLAKESNGKQKGGQSTEEEGKKRVFAWEEEKEWVTKRVFLCGRHRGAGTNYTWTTASLRRTVAFCQHGEAVRFSAHVLTCTYACVSRVCVVCMLACLQKIKPHEAPKGLHYCMWNIDWWCYIHYSEVHWIINNIWWISNTHLYVILSSCDCACIYFF